MSRIWQTFETLVSINSPSFGERDFCNTLTEYLYALNIKTMQDDAGKKINGNCNNLYGFLPGKLAQEPLLFSAHMDTVEPSKGKKAVLHTDGKITSQGDTILGADDVSGIVIILEAITRLQEMGVAHRPIELLFPVAEEVYGLGSANADYSLLKAKQAYTLDLSGKIGNAAYAAPTLFSFKISMKGKAAHAGFAPENGIHAIAAMAKALEQIPMGRPEPNITVNIGTITGGEAGNIVPDFCQVTGEIRSLSHQLVLQKWQVIQAIFEQVAKQTGVCVTATGEVKIKAYDTPLDSQVVTRFKQACSQLGIEANLVTTLGGSDQNNFAQYAGIQGIVLACSMHKVHSTREYAYLNELEQGVQLVLKLITE